MLTEKSQKIPKFFFCNFCDYNTSNKKDYNKHLLTDKHKMLTDVDKKNENKGFICECGKIYKHRQSLSVHKKKCNLIIQCTSLIPIELKEDNKELKEDNKEFKNMIKELIKENAKQQEQISELIPKIGNNNTTNNNIQNNKFNINVFLNEECKNALNMSDFIKSLHITIEQLDFTNKKGLADGLSKSIIDNMNKLSVYERPLHCTDTKRETLYIKEDNEWTKDGSKEKLKNAIKKASSKNYNALAKWKLENPDFMSNEEKTDYFTKTISTIGKPISSIDEKVIKNLCKETYVKNKEN